MDDAASSWAGSQFDSRDARLAEIDTLLRRAAEASEVSRAFYTHPADPPEQPSPVEVGTSKVLAQENERLRQQLSQVSALLTRREAAPVTAVPAGAALNANAQDAPTLADPSSSVQRAQNVVIAKLQEKVRSYKAKAEGLEESNAALRGELIALKQERRLDPAQHQDCVPLLQHSKLMQAQMDSLQANMAAEAQAALKSAESEARAHYEAVLSQERAASEAELADRAASLEALRTSEARCQEERRAAYTSLSEHQVADVQTRQRLAAAAQETKACLAALQGFVAATKTEYTTACQAFMQAMATLGGKLVSHVASADVGGLVSLIRQLEEDKEEAQSALQLSQDGFHGMAAKYEAQLAAAAKQAEAVAQGEAHALTADLCQQLTSATLEAVRQQQSLFRILHAQGRLGKAAFQLVASEGVVTAGPGRDEERDGQPAPLSQLGAAVQRHHDRLLREYAERHCHVLEALLTGDTASEDSHELPSAEQLRRQLEDARNARRADQAGLDVAIDRLLAVLRHTHTHTGGDDTALQEALASLMAARSGSMTPPTHSPAAGRRAAEGDVFGGEDGVGDGENAGTPPGQRVVDLLRDQQRSSIERRRLSSEVEALRKALAAAQDTVRDMESEREGLAEAQRHAEELQQQLEELQARGRRDNAQMRNAASAISANLALEERLGAVERELTRERLRSSSAMELLEASQVALPASEDEVEGGEGPQHGEAASAPEAEAGGEALTAGLPVFAPLGQQQTRKYRY